MIYDGVKSWPRVGGYIVGLVEIAAAFGHGEAAGTRALCRPRAG